MLVKTLPGVLAVAMLLFPAALADDKPVTFVVAGKVTDEQKVPVKGALVILTDKEGHLSNEAHTDKHGQFEIEHPPHGRAVLQVVPPEGTGLAQAFISEVPGDEGRHMLVSVRKGFTIKGRVLAGERGLKHVTVRVKPLDGDAVHGGGEVVTNMHGNFHLVLTPGQKSVEVNGIKDTNLVASFKQQYNVTTDGTMPDIRVPASRTTSVAK